MPGHIYLHAQCPCGFERKLSPGSKIAGGGFVGYTIAYNADESDLLTEDDEIINTQGLRTVDDPFPSLHENFEEKLSPPHGGNLDYSTTCDQGGPSSA
jgi:hypothetical protein